MPYFKKSPAPALLPYIESIDVQEDLNGFPQEIPTEVIPSTAIDLLFFYGDPFVYVLDNARTGTKTWLREVYAPSAFVFGQQTGPVKVRATGSTGIVIVRLLPWGLSAFTPIPVAEFSDSSIELSELFPQTQIEACLDKLRNSQSLEARADIVESMLLDHLSRLNTKKSSDQLAAQAATLLNQGLNKVHICSVAKMLDISKRQLDRRFLNTIGLTPKKFSSINRIQKALFYRGSRLTSAEIAQRAGFFDQSHMNKDFRQFLKRTPANIFGSNKTTPLMKEYNLCDLSHFYNTRYF